MTRKSFEQALEKGAIGEDVVVDYLERRGLVVYRPVTNGVHSFDMMAIKQRRQAVAIDVKAKARMSKWRATGVNQRHFLEYHAFSEKHNIPFWLFFVDECEQRIYGNNLRILEQPHTGDGVQFPYVIPTKQGGMVRLWHLDKMVHIARLSSDVCTQLQITSQRSYPY